ncbi:hypothetical protein LY76DRAFT_595195 [Colletotrichum caudatum]|nr:hypothetical protein LY76DRAFT_595195 [Colletotrichum caudatum]
MTSPEPGPVTLTKSRHANPMAGDGFMLLSPTLRTWRVALGSALHPNLCCPPISLQDGSPDGFSVPPAWADRLFQSHVVA